MSLSVLAVSGFDDEMFGITWEDIFTDENHPKTHAIVDRLHFELQLLLQAALGPSMSNFTYD